jgi:hypothetical protein
MLKEHNLSIPEYASMVLILLQFRKTWNLGTGGDLGPEGLLLIPAADSPNGKNLLIVSYEVSGTVGISEISVSNTTDNTKLIDNQKLEVYPNPATSPFLNVSQTIESGHIFNNVGQTYKVVTNTNRINIADLTPGIYFLKTNKGETAKFIVQ